MSRLKVSAKDYPAGSPIRRQLETAARETERLHRQATGPASEKSSDAYSGPAIRKPTASKLPQVNEGEELFALQLRAHRIGFEREYVFHPHRGWRFDFALPERRIGIEVEGGVWKDGGGAHSHPNNIERDIEKYNAAALLGWRILRFMPDKHIETGKAVAMLAELLTITEREV